MSLIERSKEFFGEVVVEAKRVSWPSRKELRDGTTVVVVMTIIMASIVAVLDMLLNLGLRRLFS
jgi:preprotein translocase subunit SecE